MRSVNWKKFHQLTPEEQRDAFRDFETKMQKWMDTTVYPIMGSADRSEETDKHDLIVEVGNRSIKIEEKFRTSIFDDFLVELLGDVRHPLIDQGTEKFVHHKIGWFYYCDADYLMYAMCDSPLAEEANEIYSVDMKKLKTLFPEFIKNNTYTIPLLSKKGIGYSLNIAIPWSVLEMNSVAKVVHRKPASTSL